ncbi:tRNA (adenosine(37)-N6)-threonylcarbamoyltransferase complex dimerization subunit type 1 TsaB [Candidatus Oscillochloris fontis]|uniref:tRNA (adenosine(37)-N6)-threonylcarbamoyltransferase complex dimerization subunit type 1 TsaB n=1 Tax=Candidatus Oscillochloris fontis TaxID=2496868 RepID=UPI00101BD906|nr:tRNA (adenosine(37)-N6)-threonylcarbamoyltransferase complex dimerization subunit type 1 TsaB [Candidatus Oscillochloris fontis]
MILVAIDTATTITGLALCQHGDLLAEAAWHSGRNHTAQLLPQLDLLLRHVGATPADLGAVAVALGPGSWSGLRVGLSVAKGLALAADLPLIGISSLEALAYQQQRRGLPIYPLIRLGRERFASATFRFTDWIERQTPDRNITLAELCAEIDERALFCGDLDDQVCTQIQTHLGEERALFPTPAATLRRPGFLAELAWQRYQNQTYDDLVALEPVYLGEAVQPKVAVKS